jgi:hypothetical protein
LILSAVFFLKQPAGTVSAPAAADAGIAAPTPTTASNTVMGVANPSPTPPAPVSVATNVVTPEQRQAAIETEIDHLQEWSTSDDPAMLANILTDLSNPEKEIREAAIEATKQFGSSNAIPTVKNVAANTADPDEQIALLQAAEFLSLPSISDASVQSPKTPEQIQADAQRQAARQAQQQKHAGNHKPQPLPSDQNPSPTSNNQ